MWDVELVGTNKLKAWVHYGDDFPLLVTAYEDDGVTPKDLTGKTIILGMEKNNASIGEIEGVVSSNEVLFNINYDVYFGFGIKESDKIIFDYWDKDSRETMIDKSTLDFKAVAHPTEA